MRFPRLDAVRIHNGCAEEAVKRNPIPKMVDEMRGGTQEHIRQENSK
jgi:hypothetical protein